MNTEKELLWSLWAVMQALGYRKLRSHASCSVSVDASGSHGRRNHWSGLHCKNISHRQTVQNT